MLWVPEGCDRGTVSEATVLRPTLSVMETVWAGLISLLAHMRCFVAFERQPRRAGVLHTSF